MGTKIITPPTLIADSGGIVTAASLRKHLRIATDGTEDGLMPTYFAAAHTAAEHYTGRPIGLQTLELALDEFPDGAIELGQVVKDITSVSYVDTAGAPQTVSGTNYTLDDYSCPCWLVPQVDFEWPATREVVNAVKVRFRAGEVVPGDVLSALLLMTTWLFENAGDDARSTDDIQPPAAKSLLNSAKVWGF